MPTVGLCNFKVRVVRIQGWGPRGLSSTSRTAWGQKLWPWPWSWTFCIRTHPC